MGRGGTRNGVGKDHRKAHTPNKTRPPAQQAGPSAHHSGDRVWLLLGLRGGQPRLMRLLERLNVPFLSGLDGGYLAGERKRGPFVSCGSERDPSNGIDSAITADRPAPFFPV